MHWVQSINVRGLLKVAVNVLLKLETFALLQGQERSRGLSYIGTDFAWYSDISGRLLLLHEETGIEAVEFLTQRMS